MFRFGSKTNAQIRRRRPRIIAPVIVTHELLCFQLKQQNSIPLFRLIPTIYDPLLEAASEEASLNVFGEIVSLQHVSLG